MEVTKEQEDDVQSGNEAVKVTQRYRMTKLNLAMSLSQRNRVMITTKLAWIKSN